MNLLHNHIVLVFFTNLDYFAISLLQKCTYSHDQNGADIHGQYIKTSMNVLAGWTKVSQNLFILQLAQRDLIISQCN